MEHLTKQQIVLLTLLVSFMTSLSTGIVTVSLMDQVPAGVTRTINQVIERTIQQSAPQNASVDTVTISVSDQLASATALVASSTVKIKSISKATVVGLGLVISKNGLIIADKSIIDPNQNYVALLNDGTQVSVSVSVMYQNSVANITNNSLIFLIPISLYSNGSLILFTPAQITDTFSLGQKAYSLSGSSSPILNDGIITQISTSSIVTSISSLNNTIGSPLFDIQGNIIGIQDTSTTDQMNAEFYSLAPLVSSSTVI